MLSKQEMTQYHQQQEGDYVSCSIWKREEQQMSENPSIHPSLSSAIGAG